MSRQATKTMERRQAMRFGTTEAYGNGYWLYRKNQPARWVTRGKRDHAKLSLLFYIGFMVGAALIGILSTIMANAYGLQ